MRYKVIIAVVLLISCACRKQQGFVQEKNSNGFALRLQYMPDKDSGLLCFRLNIHNNDGMPMKNSDHFKFNYGLDSLFAFVNVADTLQPVDVIRVANGNISGIEYLLLFNRPHAFSQVNCQLIFKDWLFTNQVMTFPLIDSFNQPI
jgi:hypothetical protein